MVDPIKPLRSELAAVAGGNTRVLNALERLFEVAGAETPDSLDDLQVLAQATASPVNSARGHVDFRLSDMTLRPRRLTWNDTDGTLDLGLTDDVVLQIGQEVQYYVENVTGSTIPSGAPVVATGVASGRIRIAPAIGDGSIAQRYFLGAAAHDIPTASMGYVASFGMVSGFDLSAFSAGQLLYVSSSAAGEWVNAAPSAPNWRQAQAIVASAQVDGALFVRARSEHTLTGLQDVEDAAPSDGDILMYDGANARWEAINGASGSFTTVDTKTVTVTNGIITAIV